MKYGIGVVGWGVGGIEAEGAMLGQPVYLLTPDVVGMELTGRLREGVTATDLVLTVTELLRSAKVVGKVVEFCDDGTRTLSLPDRATIANMAPKYGATLVFLPVDEKTIAYFKGTGRRRGESQPGALWRQIEGVKGAVYTWPASTCIAEPPFFYGFSMAPPPRLAGVQGARILGLFGHSITTYHISPAGSFTRMGVLPLQFKGSDTTSTAASCRLCCGNCWPLERLSAAPATARTAGTRWPQPLFAAAQTRVNRPRMLRS